MSSASSWGSLAEMVFRAWCFLTRSSAIARSNFSWGLGPRPDPGRARKEQSFIRRAELAAGCIMDNACHAASFFFLRKLVPVGKGSTDRGCRQGNLDGLALWQVPSASTQRSPTSRLQQIGGRLCQSLPCGVRAGEGEHARGSGDFCYLDSWLEATRGKGNVSHLRQVHEGDHLILIIWQVVMTGEQWLTDMQQTSLVFLRLSERHVAAHWRSRVKALPAMAELGSGKCSSMRRFLLRSSTSMTSLWTAPHRVGDASASGASWGRSWSWIRNTLGSMGI